MLDFSAPGMNNGPRIRTTMTVHLVRGSATGVDVDYFRIAWIHLAVDASGRIDSAKESNGYTAMFTVRDPMSGRGHYDFVATWN